ncbi:hypothetical protein M422DRAFT_244212 [Sphaerobolus stellatus SS14]|nr:hypothetical protein M422DRAFT_244212 [Sphaerobolus stellatus SS14]
MPPRKSSTFDDDNSDHEDQSPLQDSETPSSTTLDGMISELKMFTYYVGNDEVKSLIRWANAGSGGDVLVDNKNNQEVVLIIPMVVAFDKYVVHPFGTFKAQFENSKLSEAKYRLSGRAPEQPELREAFEKEVALLMQCQKVTQTRDVHYLFGKNSQEKPEIIFFSYPVFEKKKHPLRREDVVPHLQDFGTLSRDMPDVHAEDDVPDYPIPEDAQTAYDKICHEKRILSLPLYKNGSLVRPEDVEDILCGSLVRMEFRLSHYFWRQDKYDSFTATIEQMIMFPSDDHRPTLSPYKRCRLLDGPVRPLRK